jgi:Permuted papain-like amidase enzyme, YaeF/YiiX, C92 family
MCSKSNDKKACRTRGVVISGGWTPFFLLSIFAISFSTGCSLQRGTGVAPFPERDVSVETPYTPEELELTQRALVSSSRHMEQIAEEASVFISQAGWKKRGYLTSEEDDRMEGLLFRYLAVHDTLWNLVHQNKGLETDAAADPMSTRRAIIAFNAGFTQFHNDALFVSRFQGDKIGVAKLNEEFYRSEIPKGTYDRMKLNVTDVGKLHSLQKAWGSFSRELNNPDSGVARVYASDPFYRGLIDQTRLLSTTIDDDVRVIIDGDDEMLPSLRNELRHTRIAAGGREAGSEMGDFADATRAFVFKSVSRLKNPTAHLIKFSPAQKAQVHEALIPGDVLLSYTAGYVSDVFIPGSFKHAMVYVGTPEDRRHAGLEAGQIRGVPDDSMEKLLQSFDQPHTASGSKADLIEAVAEGVKFSNLNQILDTHINRLLVLRPQFNVNDKRQALTEVFLFLGDGYDFKFDFADASEQVCTEVVYRAYNGKGSLAFSLTKRADRETLSADDIVNYYLKKDPEAFSFVLLAMESPESKDHQAEILQGEKGFEALSRLMEEQKK